MTWEGGGAGINKINKNVTHAGSQLTWEGGGAGINKINKNVTHAGSQLTWEGGRAGINKINKNVTHAGSQLTWEGGGVASNPSMPCTSIIRFTVENFKDMKKLGEKLSTKLQSRSLKSLQLQFSNFSKSNLIQMM